MAKRERAVRCEIRNIYGAKARCYCRIGKQHGLIMDTFGHIRLYICDNHWRALRRGSTVTDIHGRQLQWVESEGLKEIPKASEVRTTSSTETSSSTTETASSEPSDS